MAINCVLHRPLSHPLELMYMYNLVFCVSSIYLHIYTLNLRMRLEDIGEVALLHYKAAQHRKQHSTESSTERPRQHREHHRKQHRKRHRKQRSTAHRYDKPSTSACTDCIFAPCADYNLHMHNPSSYSCDRTCFCMNHFTFPTE